MNQMSNKKDFSSKYDAGLDNQNDHDWLYLHRNENLLIEDFWTVDVAKEMIPQAKIGSYPEPTSNKLRQSIATLHQVKPENVFVGNGADEVLANLFSYFRDDYKTIHLLDVCFKIYPMLAERYHYITKKLPGNSFTSGLIDTDSWDGGLAVIDSPNSISSAKIQYQNILDLTTIPNSFVIWDNVYGDFSINNIPIQIIKNLITVRSFSKFYGLAGLRIGYCIGHAEIIEHLLARKDAFNVNSFAQVMGVEAINRQQYFQSIANQLILNRAQLAKLLLEFGFTFPEPSGPFIFAAHPKYNAEHIQAELAKKKIAVRRFNGGLTNNYIRIVTPSQENIQRLNSALKEII